MDLTLNEISKLLTALNFIGVTEGELLDKLTREHYKLKSELKNGRIQVPVSINTRSDCETD